MDKERRISTGIDGLDEAIDFLRPGDTVVWQCEHISDYMYVATRFVTNIARQGKRIAYIRFGDHEEIMDTAALCEGGANAQEYRLDPRVGFETFAVQVHRIIDKEPIGTFFVFDCLSDLQKYWFSDLMISNFFLLISPFLIRRQAIAYQPIDYEKHTYETISRIRREAPLLVNIRTLDGSVYMHPVKVRGRRTPTTYFPLKISGTKCRTLTSSAETYAIFERFTQTGERRDCWDSMFDSVSDGSEPIDEEGRLLKENIMRCLLGNEPTRFALCQKYFTMKDLMDIKNREIGTGCIGGKAAGMLLARNILRDEAPELYSTCIEPHDSYYIGADLFYTYGVQNGLWSSRIRMIEASDYLEQSKTIRELLLNGTFMPSIKEQFISMLEYFGQSPIIVRSSSILEDGFGNAFAGKYESVFCPNQGSLKERYEVFERAVKQVYASTVNPDAIMYRAERHLLDRDEQMALLVMRVCGDVHGDYYYPHIAGVGHSKNLYLNKQNSSSENKGMLRLVFGMGTRAVDREADDYARLLNMDAPTAPPMVAYGDEYKYSQHKMDVINLKSNEFETINVAGIDKRDIKADPSLFMELDYPTAARLREMGLSAADAPDILNFRKLLGKTDFTSVMTEAMRILEEKYNYPVDIEYACNFDEEGNYRVNLLQCRPLQTRGIGAAGVMPKVQQLYFRTEGNFMGGNVCLPVRYAVMVRVEPYLALPEQRKYQVARKLGELNSLLRDEHTILLGPGRWGTTTPSLGVPVHFMEINRFDCIAELAYSSHGLRPELSYGSHFFQDLVEADTFYVALYPGEEGCVLDEALFEECENVYSKLIRLEPGDAMSEVIRVFDLGESGAILYSEVGSQECFLAKV
jgi:pyruvate,water dikinase